VGQRHGAEVSKVTFVIKIRGAGGLMLAEYRCPVHGVFEALVTRDERGDPPPDRWCPHGDGQLPCWMTSPWTISAPAIHTQFVVSASQGKSAPKPHAEVLDTRPLAEGRKKEWRQHRKKLREERRHKRVKELLR
jgi:hypothetical protein